MYAFFEFKIKVRLRRSAWHGYQWCVRKRHLKNVIALLQTFSRLFHLIQFVKCWRIFLESNSKSLFKSSGKGKESRCLVFMSNTKRAISGFHVPHNAICFPHKILLNKNCFQFFKGRSLVPVPREIENSSYAKFCGENKLHRGERENRRLGTFTS